ncbi:aminotransferase class IV [Rathayibacter sp. VKM Ac-2927]|uniref:aminotransferase class IV n=1 Tax=Rathayibacter sp. VKM Ac-2927 TaxID=2929478 RepID=UPI002436D404|nr:aminotransferase class IV [Rathayibacter sp. VKM Ac-2927]
MTAPTGRADRGGTAPAPPPRPAARPHRRPVDQSRGSAAHPGAQGTRHRSTRAPALARSRARAAGADEAVILGADGAVIDGASSAVLWWLGDALVVPPASSRRVLSVTARTVSVLAGALGVDVIEAPAEPADLDGREVWTANALHGLRLATGWVDGPALAAVPGQLDAWRKRLDALRRPLP